MVHFIFCHPFMEVMYHMIFGDHLILLCRTCIMLIVYKLIVPRTQSEQTVQGHHSWCRMLYIWLINWWTMTRREPWYFYDNWQTNQLIARTWNGADLSSIWNKMSKFFSGISTGFCDQEKCNIPSVVPSRWIEGLDHWKYFFHKSII